MAFSPKLGRNWKTVLGMSMHTGPLRLLSAHGHLSSRVKPGGENTPPAALCHATLPCLCKAGQVIKDGSLRANAKMEPTQQGG